MVNLRHMTCFSAKPSLVAIPLLELASLTDKGPLVKTFEFFIVNSAVYQPFNFLCCFILLAQHPIFISLSVLIGSYKYEEKFPGFS